MMRVGIVGFGFMGRMHYRCWRNHPGAEVTAICDLNPVSPEKDEPVPGNVYGTSRDIDLSGVQCYKDYEAMLDAAELDAVSITLPTFLHHDFAVKALERGIHVLCEKPMALNTDQCDLMVDAADRTGKVLMVGHCIRFWPEYSWARDAIRDGRFGAVRVAHFRRLAARPRWAAQGWYSDREKSGGMPLDLHVHDTDFVHYAFGMPRQVQSFGTRLEDGTPDYLSTRYDIGRDALVLAEGGWVTASGCPLLMSFDIVLERATVLFDSAATPSFRVLSEEGEVSTPDLPDGDGYQREIAHFAAVIEGQEARMRVTPTQSRETVRIVEAEEESFACGAPVAL